MLAIPTLTFSTIILSPIENGKSDNELKLDPRDTKTSFVEVLKEIDDIDIPVEIKANAPIQIDINKSGTWQNLRQI